MLTKLKSAAKVQLFIRLNNKMLVKLQCLMEGFYTSSLYPESND